MNFKLSYFRFTQTQIRYLSSGKPKNHYDSLGVPSSSTQTEIKSAYYKLSMLYHPDKSKSAESSQRFRAITEAYEVLGNVKLRRLYDKGLSFTGSTTTTDDVTSKFHKSRETRSRPPPPTGRTPIYDFDEWSKNHYGATFQRKMEHKQWVHAQKVRREQEIDGVKMERLFLAFGIILAVCMYLFKSKSDFDNVYGFPVNKKNPNSKD